MSNSAASWRLSWWDIELYIDLIEGMLNNGQERRLFDLARSLPNDANILEIGAYKGKSTCCLAYGCVGTDKHVYSIDTFKGNEADFIRSGSFFKEWGDNVKTCGLSEYVTPLVGFSSKFYNSWDRPIHLLFIDGSHEYEDVLGDFDNFYPHVVDKGIVAFHDITEGWSGPFRVWSEHASKKLVDLRYRHSLAHGRKPSENFILDGRICSAIARYRSQMDWKVFAIRRGVYKNRSFEAIKHVLFYMRYVYKEEPVKLIEVGCGLARYAAIIKHFVLDWIEYLGIEENEVVVRAQQLWYPDVEVIHSNVASQALSKGNIIMAGSLVSQTKLWKPVVTALAYNATPWLILRDIRICQGKSHCYINPDSVYGSIEETCFNERELIRHLEEHRMALNTVIPVDEGEGWMCNTYLFRKL